MKKILTMVLTSLCILGVSSLLTGCGKTDTQDSQDGQSSQEAGSSFQVERYVSVEWEEQGNGGWVIPVYSGVRGDTIYLLVPENETGSDRSLYTFCIDNGRTEKAPFSLEIPGMETAAVHTMAVTGEGELTLRVFGALEESGNDTFLCRTDLTGKCLDEETPIREDGELPPESGRVWTGSDGLALTTESGDSNGTDILRYSLPNQKPDRLATVSGFVNALCSDGQEGVYYIENNYLWHLSAGDESAERLLGMAEAGIELTFDTHLLTDGEGGLAIWCVSAGEAGIWLLTDGEKILTADWEETPGQPGGSVESESAEQTEPVERETIRIANLYGHAGIVEAAQLGGARSTRYKIQAETEKSGTSELETLRTRTLADLTSGNGPEFLVVSEDDLYMLAEKGALMDLSELVPEDIQEQLFPGVRGAGTVDGIWVGLCWKPTISLKFTSDELWSGDSWTVSDILKLAEERQELEWISGSRDLTFEPQSYEYSYDYSSDSEGLLYFLVLSSLGDSPFLDLENGTGNFDGEEFIRVLEFCKRYGQRMGPKDGEEREAMLREGRMLVMGSSLFAGYYSYANLRVRLSGCHPVGVPAEKGSGNYISSTGYGYLVVNADATNLEAVKDCIAYLYSYDTQMNDSTVRRDVADDQIVYDELQEKWVMEIVGSKMIPDQSPDGNSFKEEYLDLLERLEPWPYCPQAIKDIVVEESSQFFDGGRSAKETAEVIQRRVQLYLDEQ